METWRLYESLEAGCIPLIERRPSLDCYAGVLGPHPIPTFAGWRAARGYAEDPRGDRQRLQAKQDEVQGWWAGRKRGLRDELSGFLSGPSRRAEPQRFAARPAHRARPIFEPLRLMELLRHQSAASLGRRLSRPAGPLRRILRESALNPSRKASG